MADTEPEKMASGPLVAIAAFLLAEDQAAFVALVDILREMARSRLDNSDEQT